MKMKKFAAITAAGLMLALSACANTNNTSEDGSKAAGAGTEPTAIVELEIKDIEDPILDNMDFGGKDWTARVEGAVIAYESAGSGSCKPIIESAVLDGNKVILTRFDYTGKPCTMDLRQFKQEITRPGGGDFPADVTFELVDPSAAE